MMAGRDTGLRSGAWEARDEEKYICRWFVAWETLHQSELAGAFAGYAGGGVFRVERFYAVQKRDRLTSLWVDFTDTVTGNEVDFGRCSTSALAAMERALDDVWTWNDHVWWEKTDEVILPIKMINELRCEGYMYYLDGASSSLVRQICEKGGLTAGPSA